MIYFGCLAIVLFLIIFIAIFFLGRIFNWVGALFYSLINSFLNLFRPKHKNKQTSSPFGRNKNEKREFSTYNYDGSQSYSPKEKLYNDSDGDYIDFEEIN